MSPLLAVLRIVHGGSAAVRVREGRMAACSGDLSVRQRHEIEAVCDMHGVTSGLVVLRPQDAGRRLAVTAYGGAAEVRQQLINALNC
jgi:hypothetical protein